MPYPMQTLLESLAGCVCNELTNADRKACFCGILPGDGVVADTGSNCDDLNGMAWVRLRTMFPSTGVGELSTVPGNCGSTIGGEIEVGILRQIAPPNTDGSRPSDAELLQASQDTITDSMLLLKAIRCCPALGPKDFVLGQWVPAGPQGMMAGGVWSLVV